MKILFYLPLVTPWWFEEIIAPMLRALYDEAELHVMVAPLWSGTGLEPRHAEPLADFPAIHWHIVMADDPVQFRLAGAQVEGLNELIAAIDPDLTLARSIDVAALDGAPGIVRYISESGAGPFRTPYRWIVLDERPFHHGVMPDHQADCADHAAALMEPMRQSLLERFGTPDAIRQRLGLPEDRPILAFPMQYEHVENFFAAGSPLQYGPEFLAEMLATLDPRILFAITDHPLNVHGLARDELHRLEARYPDRVRILPLINDKTSVTALAVHAADAVLLDLSKCVSFAAFSGTPIVHIGDSVMADWLNASPLAGLNANRLANRGLPAPDPVMARRWFGWHMGMRMLDPHRIALAPLLDRAMHRATTDDITALISHLGPWFDAGASAISAMVDAVSQPMNDLRKVA